MWTYIGQLINFIIFVVVLYALLYRPLGRILTARRQAMEKEREEAKKLTVEGQAALDEAARRESELEARRESVLSEARQQADAERKETLQAAEEQARGKVERYRRLLRQEREDALDAVRGDLRGVILDVAGRILADDMERLTQRGIERIEELLDDLSDDDLAAARKSLEERNNTVEVRCASELDEDEEEKLAKTLRKALDREDLKLEVTRAPELLAGLEVVLGHLNLSAHWQSVVDDALVGRDEAGKGDEHDRDS